MIHTNMNSASSNIGIGSGLVAARLYDEPGVRALQHALKAGSDAAVRGIALDMASFVSVNAVLVPVPGREGRGGAALRIANELSRLTGRPVVQALQGRVRASVYETKCRGVDPTTIDLGFHQVRSLHGQHALLVDNVVGTGHTAASALRAIPGATVFAHALDASAFKAAA